MVLYGGEWDKIYMEAERFVEMASQIGCRSQRPGQSLRRVYVGDAKLRWLFNKHPGYISAHAPAFVNIVTEHMRSAVRADASI
jgi:hypothetical protein